MDYLRKISWSRIDRILKNVDMAEEEKNKLIKKAIAYDLFSLKGYMMLENPLKFFVETGGMANLSNLQIQMLKYPLFILKNAEELSPTVSSKIKMMKCDVSGWEEDREFLKVFFPEFELMCVFDRERAESELKRKIADLTYDYLVGVEFKRRTTEFIELLAKEILKEAQKRATVKSDRRETNEKVR